MHARLTTYAFESTATAPIRSKRLLSTGSEILVRDTHDRPRMRPSNPDNCENKFLLFLLWIGIVVYGWVASDEIRFTFFDVVDVAKNSRNFQSAFMDFTVGKPLVLKNNVYFVCVLGDARQPKLAN
jgi:hypothetical protein